MGMFDYITCKYPLPVERANELNFQSKDTPEQLMERYEIREDGTLWCFSEENKEENWTFQENFTGEIVFYTGGNYQTSDMYWIEFSAYFVKGKLTELHPLTVDNFPPKQIEKEL